ncbi:MAG TPA: zinc ABC transporter substrate-binding protein [Virgibacillus sp.]|nr:zinc ABC transporter substrate-binding protein [Virgibacillus sp.]
MRKMYKVTVLALMLVMALVACGNNEEDSNNPDSSNNNGEQIKVVTTFTILEDMVSQIGGDHVDIHNLVPVGTDPHEYEPLPEDIMAATDADALFYNGLNLEGGDNGWLSRLTESIDQDEEETFELADGVEPMYLTSEDGKEEEINPHAFLDPVVGIQMAENTRDALIAIDPDHKEEYENNAEAYLDTLQEIDDEYSEKLAEIPEEKRVLITSERAYQYMADRYDLKEGYIWAIDTEENGTPSQVKSLINFIEENDPPVLFIESNVDERPMETVASETGLEIFGEIFSDEIGKPGEDGDTYVTFLKHNIDVIYDGLSQ